MGGAVSAGQNNEELVDNLCQEGYIHEPRVEKVLNPPPPLSLSPYLHSLLNHTHERLYQTVANCYPACQTHNVLLCLCAQLSLIHHGHRYYSV